MNYKLIQVQNLIDIDNFFERWVSFAKVFEHEDFPSFKQMFKEKELKTAFTTTAMTVSLCLEIDDSSQ